MVEWSDSLSVGVDIIDEDHKAFFRLSDLFPEIINSQDEYRFILIETYINILYEYIEAHFLREQKALMSINFPDLANHIAAHDAFSAQIYEIINQFRPNFRTFGFLTAGEWRNR